MDRREKRLILPQKSASGREIILFYNPGLYQSVKFLIFMLLWVIKNYNFRNVGSGEVFCGECKLWNIRKIRIFGVAWFLQFFLSGKEVIAMRKALYLIFIALIAHAERSEIMVLGGIEKGRKEPDIFQVRLHLSFLPGIYFIPGAGIKYERDRTVLHANMGLQYIVPIIFHPYFGVDGMLYLVRDVSPVSYAVNPERLRDFVNGAVPSTGTSFYAGLRLGLGKSLVLMGEERWIFFPGEGWKIYYTAGLSLVSAW